MRVAVAIPQNIATFMLSATPLKLRDFALASFLGLLPVTTLHVYVGANVESAAMLISGKHSAQGTLGWVSLVVGFVLTLTAVIVASRHARRALDHALAEAANGKA